MPAIAVSSRGPQTSPSHFLRQPASARTPTCAVALSRAAACCWRRRISGRAVLRLRPCAHGFKDVRDGAQCHMLVQCFICNIYLLTTVKQCSVVCVCVYMCTHRLDPRHLASILAFSPVRAPLRAEPRGLHLTPTENSCSEHCDRCEDPLAARTSRTCARSFAPPAPRTRVRNQSPRIQLRAV